MKYLIKTLATLGFLIIAILIASVIFTSYKFEFVNYIIGALTMFFCVSILK